MRLLDSYRTTGIIAATSLGVMMVVGEWSGGTGEGGGVDGMGGVGARGGTVGERRVLSRVGGGFGARGGSGRGGVESDDTVASCSSSDWKE